jgi:hypothetical protein
MLGLIFGRSCGLACVEDTLGRFRLEIEDRDGSDLFGIGPLGDGIAAVLGLMGTDPLAGPDLASSKGVKFAEMAGLARRLVSMRLIFGRACEVATASGKVISSMVSS